MAPNTYTMGPRCTYVPLCPVRLRPNSYHVWFDVAAYHQDQRYELPRFDVVPAVNESCQLVLPSGERCRVQLLTVSAWQKNFVILIVRHVHRRNLAFSLAVPYQYYAPYLNQTWREWIESWLRPTQPDRDYHIPGEYIEHGIALRLT